MTREALRDGLISQDTIANALSTARGDLFVAACYLGVTARELDGYIRADEALQFHVAAIAKVKADPEYDKISNEQFSKKLEHLTRAYRIEALDILHEMATMPMPESAAMADVKLKAAVQLRGVQKEEHRGEDHSQVLVELNQLYAQAAPRIRSIRVAQIEYQEGD